MTPAERTAAYRLRRLAEIELMTKIPCLCGCGTLIAPVNKQLKPAQYAHGHNPSGLETRFKPGNSEMARRGAEGRRAAGKLEGPGHHNWSGGEWIIATSGHYRKTITPIQAALWPTSVRHGNGWSIMRSHAVWNTAHPDDLMEVGYEMHHINLVRDDDRPENLQKLTVAEHHQLHGARRRGKPILGSPNRAKTHCPQGHPYDEVNTYMYRGSRSCRACAREKMRRRAASLRQPPG